MSDGIARQSAAGRTRYKALLGRLRDMPEDEPMTAMTPELIEGGLHETFQVDKPLATFVDD